VCPSFTPSTRSRFFSGAINSHDWELELKFVAAAIYTNYTTKIIDDMDMEHLGGYFSGPKGQKLILQFERAELEFKHGECTFGRIL